LDVLFTIDTEMQFRSGTNRDRDVEANLNANIFGKTADGTYGVDFQLETFRRHGLKSVFFVEAMASQVIGSDPLRRTVEKILDAKQEIQLHLHAEWLRRLDGGLFGTAPGIYLRDYSLDHQAEIIRIGAENLKRVGAENVVAFRAGSFGANDDTIRAVRRNGLQYDSSFNQVYQGCPCEIHFENALPLPRRLEGIVEIPITHFEDLPRHYRPLQIAACSFSELRAMLEQAYERRWPLVVIITHSFELLTQDRRRTNRVAVRRFEQICDYLGTQRDRFRTVWFSDLEPDVTEYRSSNGASLRSNVFRTMARFAEQTGSRWYEWT